MPQVSLRSQVSLLGLLFFGACSSSTDERRPITSTSDDFCQQSCEKAHACSDTIDPPVCRSSCQEALSTQPKLRGDFLGYVATCNQASSCSNASISKCKNEALAQLSISSFGQSFCAAYLAAGAQCDATGADYPESTCLEAAKTFDDSALKVASDCLAQPCSALGACLTQAIPDVTLAF